MKTYAYLFSTSTERDLELYKDYFSLKAISEKRWKKFSSDYIQARKDVWDAWIILDLLMNVNDINHIRKRAIERAMEKVMNVRSLIDCRDYWDDKENLDLKIYHNIESSLKDYSSDSDDASSP